MLWWVKSGTSFDLPYPYKKNIARNGNRGSNRVFPGEICALFLLGHTGFIDQLTQQSHAEIPSGMNRD
jgi:hypothetical protein